MPIDIDASDPLGSLAKAGATHTKTATDSADEHKVGDLTVRTLGGDGVRYDWTLPEPATFTVCFGREGLATHLSKLLKSELQVNEPAFDDTVFITTPTEKNVASFLEDQRTRDIIREIVLVGGTVAIHRTKVLYHLVGELTGADMTNMAYILGRL